MDNFKRFRSLATMVVLLSAGLLFWSGLARAGDGSSGALRDLSDGGSFPTETPTITFTPEPTVTPTPTETPLPDPYPVDNSLDVDTQQQAIQEATEVPQVTPQEETTVTTSNPPPTALWYFLCLGILIIFGAAFLGLYYRQRSHRPRK